MQKNMHFTKDLYDKAFMESKARLESLVFLTQNEPLINSCIRRIRNYCLVSGINLHENFVPLNNQFLQSISNPFYQFVYQAIDLYFMCGFVPFVVRSKDGVAIPVVLPPGTFTWSVEPSPENSSSILQYRVRIVQGNVKEEDVIIFNTVQPSLQHVVLPSPLSSLLVQYDRLNQVMQAAVEIERFNSAKHIVLSETIDLKDQTSNGIMLLDEFRRYRLTGYHPGAAQATAMRMRHAPEVQKINTVNDANMAWVKSEFGNDESIRTTVLPPNMTVTELQPISSNKDLVLERSNWSNIVHSFFDIPSQEGTQGKVNAAEANLLSREQFTNIRQMCDILERLVSFAYIKCYPKAKSVACKIDPQSRLCVNTTDDVKKLTEAGVITPADSATIKDMFLPPKKRKKT